MPHPFQCRSKVFVLTDPTAHALCADVAATAYRKSCDPTLGLGVRVQVVPFQCLIGVSAPVFPTAHASFADVAAVANRIESARAAAAAAEAGPAPAEPGIAPVSRTDSSTGTPSSRTMRGVTGHLH
jgi:hypothetical protein